jgi:NADH-quinone oxidoreductase subunit E
MTDNTLYIDEMMDQYPAKPEYLIVILQEIQNKYGFISGDAMRLASDHVHVPLTQAYAVATFYQSFRLDPVGEHEIKVCLGTACHLKGGQRLVEDLERKLHVESGGTTEDMRFTLNTVNCVGACALAPVVSVDNQYHPNATAKKMQKVLKTLTDPSLEEMEGTGNA